MMWSSGPARFQGTIIVIKRGLEILVVFYKPAGDAAQSTDGDAAAWL
jgi:hypothetical protein